MWIDTWAERVLPSWQFKSLIWGISSGFPLADHFDLPGSESIFDLSQNPPVGVCPSLGQDGFQERGLWLARHHSLFGLQRAFIDRKVSMTLRMRTLWYLIFYLGRA